MTHLISAKSRERSALWVPTLDPLGAAPSWKCQHAGPWQPPLPSARNSVTSSAEKTLTAPAGWLKQKVQNPTAWMWEVVRGVLRPQRGRRDSPPPPS